MATIKEQIEQLSDSDLLQVWLEVCDLFNLADSLIYNNDEEFFNEIWNPEPIEVARSCTHGDYHYQHEYVRFDGYGNLESSDYVADFVDEYQIEECVERYPERFGEWFEIEESELGNHLIVQSA